MSNPFKKIAKNATESQPDNTTNEASKVASRKCGGCGAARPGDTNLTTCDYCGFRFMTIENEIKTDK